MKLPTIDAPLDPGIRLVVEEMRYDGLPTFASCDGHGTSEPWVVLKGHFQGDTDALLLYGRVVNWLERRGLTGATVALCRQVGAGKGEVRFGGEVVGTVDEMFVRVEWWTSAVVDEWRSKWEGVHSASDTSEITIGPAVCSRHGRSNCIRCFPPPTRAEVVSRAANLARRTGACADGRHEHCDGTWTHYVRNIGPTVGPCACDCHKAIDDASVGPYDFAPAFDAVCRWLLPDVLIHQTNLSPSVLLDRLVELGWTPPGLATDKATTDPEVVVRFQRGDLNYLQAALVRWFERTGDSDSYRRMRDAVTASVSASAAEPTGGTRND